MSTSISANRLELLQIADAVAREKLIGKELVLKAMEEAIQKAARSKYGQEYDIRTKINVRSGEMMMSRVRTVVDVVANPFTEIALQDALRIKADAALGEEIADSLPPMDFGRIAAQTAKQVIVQKVREAERERQYEEYRGRIGEVINGIVKRVEYGNVIVDLGRAEAILRRDQIIARESWRVGDRIRALLKDVRSEVSGHQLFLSRTAPEFMIRLFAQEVPEIYDGIIEIKAVARDPGSRAKIGVISYDQSIDPVGACVGMRGNRVQAVVAELQGEKIDIVPWSPDAATFIVNALQPATVSKVVMDEELRRIQVVVPDDQLSLAIGRRGQNVRLASHLTGWQIDIMTEAQESEHRQRDFEQKTALFVEVLHVDEMIGQLLVSEGFSSLEEIAFVDIEELTSIDGFDSETAEELQARAQSHVKEINEKALGSARDMGVDDTLIGFPGLTPVMIEALGRQGILRLEDFAILADWELAGGSTVVGGVRIKDEGILESMGLTIEDARNLVMSARIALGIVDSDVLLKEEVSAAASEPLDDETSG